MIQFKKVRLLAILFFCVSFLFANINFSLAQTEDNGGSVKGEEVLGQKTGDSQKQSDKETQENKTKKKKRKKKGKGKRKNSSEKKSMDETKNLEENKQ